jgi:uncharacterized protein (DUF4415 family)
VRRDADLLAWFKTQGSLYPMRMNRALREMMTEDEKGFER